MDKKIVLKMLPSKDIVISVDGGNSLTIPKDNRCIKGADLYRLINFSRGDIIEVESENENSVDVPVLAFFLELISIIAKKVNQISDSDEDEYLIGKS